MEDSGRNRISVELFMYPFIVYIIFEVLAGFISGMISCICTQKMILDVVIVLA
ncbi:hypothetical protein M6B38_185670 [Iris pallida]|uniref:Uncharacterized protein n=1 Tax=Iris pallida TaxID=29817 RepID=A0AAX6EJG8_IRIPA|nr:hypothetical protein M6B38_185670 [Iris pallida]